MDRATTWKPKPEAAVLAAARVWMLVLLSGCGGVDYRAQVEKTNQRMAILEEEDALLEQPVSLSDRAPPVFFRPPKGVATRASEGSVPKSDWLFHLPAEGPRLLAPPLEVLAGSAEKRVSEDEQGFLQARVLGYLRQHADEQPARRAGDTPTTVSCTRLSDHPAERRSVEYRRYRYHTDQELPQWPAPARAQLQGRCVYEYEIYITDAGERWGVVIFKLLNAELTGNHWRQKGIAAELVGRLPSFQVRRLSALNPDGTAIESREASLATLRIGVPARQRLRLLQK